MVIFSERIIIDKRTDISDFSLIFVSQMCVFVSRPMKIVTFVRKNGDHPKRVVDFPRERDTFRNKILDIVEDFDETSYNNNGKHGNRRGFCVRIQISSCFYVSFFFHHFSHFFIFFHLFIFHEKKSFFLFCENTTSEQHLLVMS